ncbi:N-acetylmuramoyl-L-alanine amidase [Mucilaginibacter sp. RS28]|uniref:N-acetylmuramoyl-L-alanine amidase n=1 Tax=Mucilaginibacter straminoryzae TaxID=2932774 RepID=A0A9X1X420_9SPHI|nr:N-acetylmuramoyl-L-alanine amidase [Mucilaginibacter straminoryzae]MCJ8210566.1 N-acetylmuramoyl-L-alanine amidase [Mucilaginibacter straminoryzae]
MKTLYLLLAVALVLSACSPKGPYAVTDKVYNQQTKDFLKTIGQTAPPALIDSTGTPVPGEWVGTVNFGMRKPNYVIIHYTAQDSVQQTLKTFTIKKTAVSAHYVVAKDGKIYHMVNDYLKANQAGIGKWGSITDMNSCSIGIEIDNNGFEPYTDAQIKNLIALLGYLKTTYSIPTANFIGHGDWAPKRKPDPGKLFPWKLMAQHGFSYWSDDILVPAPDNFDYLTALRLIGYDVSNPKAAIVAFKRHFVQSDVTPQMTQLDLNILYNVYQKY